MKTYQIQIFDSTRIDYRKGNKFVWPSLNMNTIHTVFYLFFNKTNCISLQKRWALAVYQSSHAERVQCGVHRHMFILENECGSLKNKYSERKI